MTRSTKMKSVSLLAVLLISTAVPVMAQAPPPPALLADHYDISATLDPITQTLSAVAKVDFKAREVSGAVRVELHPNLKVSDVRSAEGKTLGFERDSQNPLIVIVNLPTPVAATGKVTLTFSYAGPLANEENSPVPGVRAAAITRDGAFLLLPARWFPLTNYPSNRYTATFKLNVPDSFAVVGTGKAAAPTPTPGKNTVEGNRLVYTFQCDSPAPHGTFVAGNLQLNPKQAEGINVNVYAPREMSGDAQKFADSVARSTIAFSDMFGPLPRPEFTVAQLPDGTPACCFSANASGIPAPPTAPSRAWSLHNGGVTPCCPPRAATSGSAMASRATPKPSTPSKMLAKRPASKPSTNLP